MSSIITKVYVDGIYDLYHRGHVESFIKAKNIRENVYLIVGLITNSVAENYKRKPIYCNRDYHGALFNNIFWCYPSSNFSCTHYTCHQFLHYFIL